MNTEQLLKQAEEEASVLLSAADKFDKLSIEPETGRRLAELIAEMAAALKNQEYQPISTAPKDGREFYICVPVRWKAYKSEARKQGYPEGRFQEFDGYRWKNLGFEPKHWLRSQEAPTPQEGKNG